MVPRTAAEVRSATDPVAHIREPLDDLLADAKSAIAKTIRVRPRLPGLTCRSFGLAGPTRTSG